MQQATAVINTTIKPEIKKEFERVTSQLGLTSIYCRSYKASGNSL